MVGRANRAEGFRGIDGYRFASIAPEEGADRVGCQMLPRAVPELFVFRSHLRANF